MASSLERNPLMVFHPPIAHPKTTAHAQLMWPASTFQLSSMGGTYTRTAGYGWATEKPWLGSLAQRPTKYPSKDGPK